MLRLRFGKPPAWTNPVVPCWLAGHSLPSQGVGNLRDASSGGQRAGLVLDSDPTAPNPGTGRKGGRQHRVPPPTGSARGCSTHHLSQDQPHSKTSDLSEANLGLGFCRKKTCFNQKYMGQDGRFSFSKIPLVLQSPGSTTNTVEREPGGCSAGWGSMAVLSFGGNSMGLVNSSQKHQAGQPATISLHLPAPTPTRQRRLSTRQRCHVALSNEHHGCRTAEETGPRRSQTTPVLPLLISPFHFVIFPQNGEKKKLKKISKLQHFKFPLGFKTLSAMTVTSNR